MKTKLLFNNTYKSGSVTYLILKEKNKFTGVCLEFDLEVQANTLKDAMEQIEDYAHLWHRNAIKHKLPEEVLNRPAPKIYWQIYEKAVREDLKKLKAEKQGITTPVVASQRVMTCQTSYPNFAFA